MDAGLLDTSGSDPRDLMWVVGTHVKAAALAALVAGGLVVYALLALALGAVRAGELKDRLRRRGAA